MTYAEVISYAEKFSKDLDGIKCCAILCKSEMTASIALLSCFAAGATALPLSHRYGELHCNKIIQAIGPDAVITDNNGEFQIKVISDYTYTEPEIKPALIMCTSGTTGTPKGAMLTENNILANITDIAAYFNIDDQDTILISRPIYHCAVLTGEFLTSLLKGVKIHFYSDAFNPTIILKLIKELSITTFCGTPTLLGMMARFVRNSDNIPLKHICISGECMGMETATRIYNAFPSANIYSVYGLTEACPRVSFLHPKLFRAYADCVGIALESVIIKILLPDGSRADKNQIGILWVKGDNIMAGYYNDPIKTAEVLKDGWLCTGDLALINDIGLLQIKGRADNMIIKAGMNIYPQEIESALKNDIRTKEALIYSESDEKYGVKIILDIVGDFNNIQEVKELCKACLPAYQIPSKINLLNELPKNGSGKVIRK